MGKDTAHAKYYIISSKVHETALAGQAENWVQIILWAQIILQWHNKEDCHNFVRDNKNTKLHYIWKVNKHKTADISQAPL
jgi:hypothetical protein